MIMLLQYLHQVIMSYEAKDGVEEARCKELAREAGRKAVKAWVAAGSPVG